MKELIAQMYKILLLKRFRSKAQIERVISVMVSSGMNRDVAIITEFVAYMNSLLGLASANQIIDQEDEFQMQRHEAG